MTEAVPAILIGGYLGAGKTTLVNHLLRHAGGRRIAVLVNDFGEVSIDADLIVGAEDGVLSLAGGCVCCSFGSDLVGTLAEVLRRDPRPDAVLIETSGVGIPSAVARAARLVPGLRLEATVVVADAPTVQARAADRYVGDTVRQQLDDADLLLLNQTDRVDAATLTRLQAWWTAGHPRTPLWPTVRAQVPAEGVLGFQARHAEEPADAAPAEEPQGAERAGALGLTSDPPRSWPRAQAVAPAADVFESGLLHLPGPVDVQALIAGWEADAGRLVRAKGIVQAREGGLVSVQWAGRQAHVEPWTATIDSERVGWVAWIALRRRP
ncbi:MAG: GTP-binding protein [Rubrivivax sp.]|jgi:G3E family GTPase|nr:GTP-binding protein [Rubrivivax sp.]